MQEVIMSKLESIEKCIKRIEQKTNEKEFDLEDYDYQDIIVMNIQRACQQAIDVAMFICAEKGLGFPKDSADAFAKLLEGKIISQEIFNRMKSMVGFRNVAIHEYQNINYEIVKAILDKHLEDFGNYNKELIENLID